MVPLDLDDPVLDRTACSAALFQFADQRPDTFDIQRNADDNGDRLSAAPFRLAPDTDDAITASWAALFTADAAVDRTGALRADPAGVGGIDKSGV